MDYVHNCYGRFCTCEKEPPAPPKGGPELRSLDPKREAEAAAAQTKNANAIGLFACGPLCSLGALADLFGAPPEVVTNLSEIELNMFLGGGVRGSSGVGARAGARLPSRPLEPGAAPKPIEPAKGTDFDRLLQKNETDFERLKKAPSRLGTAAASAENGGAYVKKRQARFDSRYGTRRELKELLDDLEPGEGASVVYDKRTGEFVIARSGQGELPEGWVSRNGGHLTLAEDHWGMHDVALIQGKHNPFVGGAITRAADGSLSVTWVSGQLNGGAASLANQLAGVEALGSFANPLTPSGLSSLIQNAAGTPSGLLDALKPNPYPIMK